MTGVQRSGEGIVVEARLLGEVFGLTEDEVRTKMRDRAITSLCEEGVGEDAGRWRLTFHHADRACRLIVDDRGTVVKRATFPIRARQPGARPRRPSPAR